MSNPPLNPGIPPYASPTQSTARLPLSAAALTSFILSLLFCIPVVTSLTALLFAAIGFKATRNQAKRGRGFAIAGLTLSLLGLAAWCAIGAFTLFLISASAAPRATLHTFAHNLFTGNLPAASADFDPAVPAATLQSQLETIQTYVASFGTYSDLTCTSINISATPGAKTCQLSGTARFSTSTHSFTATLFQSPSGPWKVRFFNIL